jgi:hypothetical protein
MDWIVFFAVMTWAITGTAAVTTLISLITLADPYLASARGMCLRLIAVCLPIIVLGAATIGGMGWA